MHEIITLQLGQRSNYVATHFWNTQVYFRPREKPFSDTQSRNLTSRTLLTKSPWLIMTYIFVLASVQMALRPLLPEPSFMISRVDLGL